MRVDLNSAEGNLTRVVLSRPPIPGFAERILATEEPRSAIIVGCNYCCPGPQRRVNDADGRPNHGYARLSDGYRDCPTRGGAHLFGPSYCIDWLHAGGPG